MGHRMNEYDREEVSGLDDGWVRQGVSGTWVG